MHQFQDTIEKLQNEGQAFEEENRRSKEAVTDLESTNRQLRAEVDQIRSELTIHEGDRQAMEKDIVDCREQIRELELIKSEWTETQQSSLTSVSRSSEDDPNASISQPSHSPANQSAESVPTLLSDVPTLLFSLGITEYSHDEIESPFNLQSILYLCSLLIDRCRTLQSDTLVKTSLSDDAVTSATQTDRDEQDRMVIDDDEQSEFSQLVNYISTWMHHSEDSHQEKRGLSRYVDQV